MESTSPSLIATAMQERTQHEIEVLIADLRPWLYRLALAIVARPDVAEDVTQETLLRATRSVSKLRRADDPKAWLRRVLVNRAVTALGQRRNARLEETHPASGDETASIAVRATLEKLQPTERAMLALWHFEGLSYEEMAQILEIPIGTVGSRLTTAREAFRKEWLK
jgi:RNA polymerase sigma-70 factor (ECF subfamily)